MNKLLKWVSTHQIAVGIIVIFLIALIVLMVDIGLQSPYTLRPDRFDHYFKYLFFIFFPLILISDMLRRIRDKHRPYMTFFALFLIFLFACIKLIAVALLIHNDAPFTTAKAFVVHLGKSSYRLRFPNDEPISNKEFLVFAQTHAQTGDCLSVRYRENALIIEVRTIQNLGKRTQKECLKEKFFRQPEKTHTPHKNAIISSLLN